MKKPTKPVEKLVFKPVKRQTPAQKRAARDAALEAVTRNVEIAVMELVQELRPCEQPAVAAAIDAEAADWANFFNVSEAEQIEGRRRVMRANVAVGYIEPLQPYLNRMPNPFSEI